MGEPEDIVVGGPSFRNVMDQNSALAAAMLAAPSAGIAR